MSSFEYFKRRKLFQKIDALVLLAGFVLSICLLFVLVPQKGTTAAIYVNGNLFGKYELDRNRTIALPHCTLKIEDGAIFMADSNCPNKQCIRTGAIRSAHQSIVCAPNGVVAVVEGESDFDAVIGGGA